MRANLAIGFVCALVGAIAVAQPAATPETGRTVAEVVAILRANYDGLTTTTPAAMWHAGVTKLAEAFPSIQIEKSAHVKELTDFLWASSRLLRALAAKHPEQAAAYEATFLVGAVSALDPLTSYHPPEQHAEELRNRVERTTRGEDRVEAHVLDGGEVHLRVPTLLPDAVRQTQRAIDGSARGVILDLRGNVGGSLDAATRLVRLFVATGTILVTTGRNSPEQETRGDASASAALPLVVLVDAVTAGGAEIVAAALRDNDRALLLGAKTAGKGGSIQSVVELRDGGSLKLTIAHYLVGPRRVDLRAGGLSPDVEASGDAALTRAHAILRKSTGPGRRDLLRAATGVSVE
jgi:hypothetical protein